MLQGILAQGHLEMSYFGNLWSLAQQFSRNEFCVYKNVKTVSEATYKFTKSKETSAVAFIHSQ